MTQEQGLDWATRLALKVAGEVRRHRQDQGLSAQQLSDRCAVLGMPIQRSVLANLESGRRTTVTAAEILVLAHALNVPPGILLFPVGYEAETEMLPGRYTEPVAAVEWLAGRTFFDDNAADHFFDTPLGLARVHQDAVRQLQSAMRRVSHARAEHDRAISQYGSLASEHEHLTAQLVVIEAETKALLTNRKEGENLDLDRLRVLERSHRELAAQITSPGAAKYRVDHARDAADRAEQARLNNEATVRKYRDEMKLRGLKLPALPMELQYLDPDSETVEDRKPEPESRSAAAVVESEPAAEVEREISSQGVTPDEELDRRIDAALQRIKPALASEIAESVAAALKDGR
ncbi:helix-turn-helix domain-containing protein [Streptomyces sp. NPDC060322]|uniref:helix-turn-helix domain-containing protein n=1 Tax=Streptomyces sp. NPDC060322 TaxID=3347097 RepID=UPI003653B17D